MTKLIEGETVDMLMENVYLVRRDIGSFLFHFTKKKRSPARSAADVLRDILSDNKLIGASGPTNGDLFHRSADYRARCRIPLGQSSAQKTAPTLRTVWCSRNEKMAVPPGRPARYLSTRFGTRLVTTRTPVQTRAI